MLQYASRSRKYGVHMGIYIYIHMHMCSQPPNIRYPSAPGGMCCTIHRGGTERNINVPSRRWQFNGHLQSGSLPDFGVLKHHIVAHCQKQKVMFAKKMLRNPRANPFKVHIPKYIVSKQHPRNTGVFVLVFLYIPLLASSNLIEPECTLRKM